MISYNKRDQLSVDNIRQQGERGPGSDEGLLRKPRAPASDCQMALDAIYALSLSIYIYIYMYI